MDVSIFERHAKLLCLLDCVYNLATGQYDQFDGRHYPRIRSQGQGGHSYPSFFETIHNPYEICSRFGDRLDLL